MKLRELQQTFAVSAAELLFRRQVGGNGADPSALPDGPEPASIADALTVAVRWSPNSYAGLGLILDYDRLSRKHFRRSSAMSGILDRLAGVEPCRWPKPAIIGAELLTVSPRGPLFVFKTSRGLRARVPPSRWIRGQRQAHRERCRYAGRTSRACPNATVRPPAWAGVRLFPHARGTRRSYRGTAERDRPLPYYLSFRLAVRSSGD